MAIGHASNKATRPATDFELQLKRQLGYLRRSCKIFDLGEHDEAIRIAVSLRVLLHQTKSSTSLLTHLGIQDSLAYVDTGVYRNLLTPAVQAHVDKTTPGLVAMQTAVDVGLVELGYAGNGRIGWYAPLRLRRFAAGSPPDIANPKTSKFSDWWTNPLVETTKRVSFSRSNLVLIMANQDGGGHVDAALDADYSSLIIDPLAGAAVFEGGHHGEIPDILHNVAFASVRQIAFELICTIERYWHVRDNPGALLLADPYADMPMPTPPHRVWNAPRGIVLGRPVIE